MTDVLPASAAGLGLRRGLIPEWRALEQAGYGDLCRPSFIEITPENWLGMGGRFSRDLRWFTERFPVYAHGLSLSIGGPDPLDLDFITRLKTFLDEHHVSVFSEHLSYCTDGGHLYDLMPIPFTGAAVTRVAERIAQVQDHLQRQLVLENVSYYAAPGQEMSELEFIKGVLAGSGCLLLLDINNVWVNSVNHGYDPKAFIAGLPAERIVYQHIAGHFREAPDLIIDTHGAPVADEVWSLFAWTQQTLGPRPTVLERDFNLPSMPSLLSELGVLSELLGGNVAETPEMEVG